AIKSLKVAHCLMTNIPNNGHNNDGTNDTFTFRGQQVIINNGLIVKQGNLTAAYNNAYFTYKGIIEDFCIKKFSINVLNRQIGNECIQLFHDRCENGRDESNYGNATSLIMPVNNVISDNNHSGMFGFNAPTTNNLITKINEFINNPN